ncbi:hypothetical protein Poli38472_000319 [Pythium oligandrum]|uniref:Uncharacterized protein n=1 Tax=Pythium oligandrum TaxID=41045 RepID=A0A8K1CBQ5_PYTOL|nr:hypothetical protein Poli38472_000319 [Pythium oligandrum]|eukprot:TMW60277.1 hypothetical protein Poli38472_000319 [Pythium oligandrum]
MPDDDSGDVREPDPTDVNQAAQLAYMEQMYTTIQQLNAELDRERADAKRRAASIESHVENREHATLDVLHGIGAEVEESENFGVVGAQIPIGGAGVSSAATVNKRFRPHQPRPTALPDPKAALAKEQLELCAALGKNAELRIRNREIEKQSESSSQVLEQTQRQMKMAERRIANREEKLRGLLKEKLHWQNEMKDLRELVVEEKMRQVDLLRRLETTKREAIAQVDAMAQMLRDVEEENQALRVHLVETKNQLASQTKKLEDVVRQSRDEKEKLVECINEARSKFKEWKDGEANVLRAQKDQAVNNLKAEYELKIARHQEEKQKLRDKVKDLEVSVRLMQKDRSLSPLELSLRKAAILGGRDSAGTTEGEVIEANVRIKELEAMLEHTAEYQKRQENIIKVSQATISRLLQEREVAALDGLASQPLLGSNGLVNSSAAPPDSSYFPFGAVSPIPGPDNCETAACHAPEVLEAVPVIGSPQPLVGDPNTLSSEYAQYIPTQRGATGMETMTHQSTSL